MAYADPPYVGFARYYKSHPDYAGEVDHTALIERLVAEYPDGWALSCYSNSLRLLLPSCPNEARVLAWVKPWCSFKPGVTVAYAWEPVIVCGGRKRDKSQATVRDWLAVSATTGRGLIGVKPEAFCFWLFAVLNLQPDDQLDDLFPGSGAVTRAWERYQRQLWPAPS